MRARMQCTRAKRLCSFLAFAAALIAGAAPSPSSAALSQGDALLQKIRAVFRSHRPPPPYVTYTLVRQQNTAAGYPDFVWSYTYHIWCRTSDRAALGRKVYRGDARGALEFLRPEFNQARDPGPPTADVFEPAPLHTPPPGFVPTPEASLPPVIVTVRARGEFDYRVTDIEHEGDELHLKLQPRREPDRNRLREMWVDAKTLDLRKLVATDKLFVEKGPVYPVLFTITFEMYETIPVITKIHGVVYGGYDGDGQIVDYDFRDLKFPLKMPDWYFNPRDYAQHQNDAPE